MVLRFPVATVRAHRRVLTYKARPEEPAVVTSITGSEKQP